MDFPIDLKTASAIAGAIGIISPGISIAWTFFQKAKSEIRSNRESRQKEILRLQECLNKHQEIFAIIFDYDSPLDHHLRIDSTIFTEDEVKTRTMVDIAFEHLRDLHRSVMLGLISKSDLGPWIYWIHRIQSRKPLHAYARACGYIVFLDELKKWTESSKELDTLKQHCPWFGNCTQTRNSPA